MCRVSGATCDSVRAAGLSCSRFNSAAINTQQSHCKSSRWEKLNYLLLLLVFLERKKKCVECVCFLLLLLSVKVWKKWWLNLSLQLSVVFFDKWPARSWTPELNRLPSLFLFLLWGDFLVVSERLHASFLSLSFWFHYTLPPFSYLTSTPLPPRGGESHHPSFSTNVFYFICMNATSRSQQLGNPKTIQIKKTNIS